MTKIKTKVAVEGGKANDSMTGEPGAPKAVDRSIFQAELDALRVREKIHTREGDAIAAARRRLPYFAANYVRGLIITALTTIVVAAPLFPRSEEHTSELQSPCNL